MLLSLVLIAVLMFMLAGNFFSLMGRMTGGVSKGHRGRPGLLEVVVEDHDSVSKIALIDIDGIISGSTVDGYTRDLVSTVKDQLKMAAEADEVKAVILKVDSPGGEVMASDEISRAIANFQKESKKPVIASFGGMAASGGYYVSAPCRWIVAHELTLTGSIGVIMHTWNYRGLLDKLGVLPVVIKSGKYKDMLRGDKSPEEILPEETQMLEALIQQTYVRFKDVVATGRQEAQNKNKTEGRALAKNWTEYADGRVLSGKEAYEHGFVDELGTFDTAVRRAEKIAGLKRATLIRFEQPLDFGNILRWFVKTETPAIKVDLGLEQPKVKPGRLYYLVPALCP
jgi:protease IV